MAPIKEWFGAYNVIFRWFEKNYDKEALTEYWKFLAENCFQETVERFKKGGLDEIDNYFRETFEIDGGEYVSSFSENILLCEIKKCPDHDFMKSSDNPCFKPIEDYCGHHDIINSVIAQRAGFTFRMLECSGKGQCRWMFQKQAH